MRIKCRSELAERRGDGAFAGSYDRNFGRSGRQSQIKSGVALRLPPHSRSIGRLLTILAICFCATFAEEFRSGIAVRVVTPDPLLPVSGGVGPSHPTNRKLGELTVRALVMEEGQTRVAIVGS